LLESGAALHDIQAFLGHANIKTTSRYLQSTPVRLEQALARMERNARRIRTGFAQEAPESVPEPPKADPAATLSR
jgi:hypothetical protein